MEIDWNSWERPEIFKLIQKEGNVSEEEMRAAFNLGIGMILVVNPSNAEEVMNQCNTHNPTIMGKII